MTDGPKSDVFVSYAHIDNEPLIPGDSESCWVASLVAQLRAQLSTKLGRRAEVWLDPLLRRHGPFPDEIQPAVAGASALLIVVSPSYLESEWCRRERELFVEATGGMDSASGRLFVVHKEQVARADMPVEFRQLLGYTFYDCDDQDEWRSIGARDLSTAVYTAHTPPRRRSQLVARY